MELRFVPRWFSKVSDLVVRADGWGRLFLKFAALSWIRTWETFQHFALKTQQDLKSRQKIMFPAICLSALLLTDTHTHTQTHMWKHMVAADRWRDLTAITTRLFGLFVFYCSFETAKCGTVWQAARSREEARDVIPSSSPSVFQATLTAGVFSLPVTHCTFSICMFVPVWMDKTTGNLYSFIWITAPDTQVSAGCCVFTFSALVLFYLLDGFTSTCTDWDIQSVLVCRYNVDVCVSVTHKAQ